jgi:hypothetical protein
MADFAPYQDIPPERNRALSPPLPSTRSPPPNSKSPPVGYQQQPPHSRNASRNIGTAAVHTPTSPNIPRTGTANSDYFNPGQGWPAPAQHQHDDEHDEEEDLEGGRQQERRSLWGIGNPLGGLGGMGRNREDVDLFETRLGIRMDFEACLAYLFLPPVGGVLLLILEQTSDYVR